ncbi:MAG: class I SAM-dependent methyltransferase [Solirubrobacteraceae bacterium]
MKIHPLAAQFAEVAGAYERGRPEYAPAVIGALAAELKLAPGARILDLAAGTGKLTRTLLAGGFDVIAVEPLDALRRAMVASVGAERVREGRAEKIPLPDASVYAVTVADAFHWFDQAAAMSEIRRVLRSGGGLAVIHTAPDWGDAPWAHDLGRLMNGLRPPHPHYDGPSWREALGGSGGWSAPWEVRVTTRQAVTAEQLLDYLASISWIAAMPAEHRADTLAQAAAILSRGEAPGEIAVHVTIGLAALA